MTGKRDRAILAVLLGCGLRRSEAVRLNVEHFQRRDEHWAIVNLFGKGGHVRSVPVPDWVKRAVDGGSKRPAYKLGASSAVWLTMDSFGTAGLPKK